MERAALPRSCPTISVWNTRSAHFWQTGLSRRIVSAATRWIPLAAESAECVFSFNTLEHVADVDLAFSEMDRVLRPGGWLVLKPAWHCTRYITELIPILPYSKLNPRQKLTKALLPLLKSKIYKCATRIPARVGRRLTSSAKALLRWGQLTPYHGDAWIATQTPLPASIVMREFFTT